MSGTLALASAIAEMDRSALRALVARRRPQTANSISDPIGLATDLLRTDSITRAILPLERAELRTLLAFAEHPETGDANQLAPLAALGLVGQESARWVPLPEVTAVMSEAIAATGLSVADLVAEDPAPQPGAPGTSTAETAALTGAPPTADTGTWYSPAFTAVGQAAECVRVLTLRPSKLNRNGTVAVVSLRALADTTSINVESVSRIMTALGHAKLTSPHPQQQLLLASAFAPAWLAQDNRDRWLALAESVMAAIPAPLRIALASTHGNLGAAAAALPARFPLLPAAELAAANAYAAVAEQLGLTVSGQLSPPAERLYAADAAGARAVVTAQTPDAAPGVYVQPDLSVVVPGPLDPSDEAVLSAISRPEQIGVASTRRISDSSIAEGLEQGISPDTAHAFFARVSLTGIPQPLEYLLATRAQRLGDLVVDEHDGDGGRTRITVSRPELAETLLVDRSLQHLQLVRADHTPEPAGVTSAPVRLYSRLRAEHVISALTDARYHPTTSAALTGAQSAPARHVDRVDTPTAAIPIVDVSPATREEDALADALTEAHDALTERVYLAARAEPGSGEFTRRLELALRDRSPVRVTAESKGEVRTFTLLPVSVNNGRLRATDQVAGVERTLPVSMITRVESV